MNKKTNKMNKMLGGREQEANSMVNTPSGETFADRYINALTNTAKKISQQIQNISGTAASKISDVVIFGSTTSFTNRTLWLSAGCLVLWK